MEKIGDFIRPMVKVSDCVIIHIYRMCLRCLFLACVRLYVQGDIEYFMSVILKQLILSLVSGVALSLSLVYLHALVMLLVLNLDAAKQWSGEHFVIFYVLNPLVTAIAGFVVGVVLTRIVEERYVSMAVVLSASAIATYVVLVYFSGIIIRPYMFIECAALGFSVAFAVIKKLNKKK